MKRMQAVPFLVGITCMETLVPVVTVQSAAGAGSSSNTAALPFSGTPHAPRDLSYTRPSEKTRIRNYFFDAFSTYADAGAVISTVTARHSADGRGRLSFQAIVAPYVGATTAIYGWYAGPYGVKDSLRMCNHAILATPAGNIARDFLYGRSHTLLSQLDRPGPPETESAENAPNH